MRTPSLAAPASLRSMFPFFPMKNVVGNERISYARTISLVVSSATGYVTPASSANARTFSRVSDMAMPTNTTSLSRYSCHMVSKKGISQRQGGHHEAQKLRTTTLPLRSESRSVSPSNVSTSKSGATLDSLWTRVVMVRGVGAGVAVTVGSGVGDGGVGVGSGVAVGGSGLVVGVGTGPVVWVGVGLSPPLDCAHERLRQTAISRMMLAVLCLLHVLVGRSNMSAQPSHTGGELKYSGDPKRGNMGQTPLSRSSQTMPVSV